MPQRNRIHEYEKYERDLFVALSLIALGVAGIGLLMLLATFLILFQ